MLTGLGLAASLIARLVRTFIDYRRWSRVARVQAEVHAKILDRLASNEDLLADIHSPAGQKFLESAPIHLESGGRPVAAPLGRILWAVQGGIVMRAAGAGLLFISTRVDPLAAQPLHTFGTLALAPGAGFLLSAVAAFAISRRPPAMQGSRRDRRSPDRRHTSACRTVTHFRTASPPQPAWRGRP